jgi:hypothetical protein
VSVPCFLLASFQGGSSWESNGQLNGAARPASPAALGHFPAHPSQSRTAQGPSRQAPMRHPPLGDASLTSEH